MLLLYADSLLPNDRLHKTNYTLITVDGGIPLIPGSPSINAELLISLNQKPGEACMYKVAGFHDGFPAYELYVNKKLVYSFDPVAEDQTPLSLLPPMEIDVSKKFPDYKLLSSINDLVPLSNIPLDPGNGGRSIGVGALQIGDIILSTTNELPSKIIRAGTDSPVSHSILYIGGNMVVEAIQEGVKMRTLQEALAHASLAVALRYQGLTSGQGLEIVDFAGQQIDKECNYRYGVIQQALFRLDVMTICAGKTSNSLNECKQWAGRLNLGTGTNDKWFCSELLIASYAKAGVPLTTMPPSWTAPGEIIEVRDAGKLAYVGHLKTSL